MTDTSAGAVNALISDLCHDYADDLERRASDMVRSLAAERDRQYDENVTQIMKVAALEAEAQRMREALEWYEEKARLCRLIHNEGEAARQALHRDGGAIACAALTPQPEEPRT